MTAITAKVQNGMIRLPKEVVNEWNGVSVFLLVGEDWLTVKKIEEPSLEELLPRLRAAGKGITQKEIDLEVAAVRKELRRKRRTQ